MGPVGALGRGRLDLTQDLGSITGPGTMFDASGGHRDDDGGRDDGPNVEGSLDTTVKCR